MDEAVWWGLQSKEALACLTPGCEGMLTRAVVLGAEAGVYKELYSRPLRGKRSAQPQPSATAAVAVPARRGQETMDAGEALCIECFAEEERTPLCWVQTYASLVADAC